MAVCATSIATVFIRISNVNTDFSWGKIFTHWFLCHVQLAKQNIFLQVALILESLRPESSDQIRYQNRVIHQNQYLNTLLALLACICIHQSVARTLVLAKNNKQKQAKKEKERERNRKNTF